MKRKLLLCLLLMSTFIGAFAQGEIIIGTSTPIGQNFKFYLTLVDANSKVYVDWGDGNKVEANLSGWSSIKNTEGVLKNDTIIVYGDLATLDVENQHVNVLAFKNQDKLTQISAKKNELTFEGIDLTGVPNLVNLDVSENKIKRLKVDNLLKLEQFTANKNPDLSTVIFAEGSTALRGIYMADCDITHFYPISLPNLSNLDLGNGSLNELELGENYPNLTTLNVSNSTYLASIDVTKLTKLNKLNIAGTAIVELNLVNNPEFIYLDATKTNIPKLDISKNTKITTLLLADTKIAKLDLSHLANLQTLNIENTLIKRIDLSNSRFIRDVNIKGTGIQFLDMHAAIGTNRLNKLDMRDCKKMTPQSLNFTFKAMPPHTGSSWGPNVLIAGSNGETANTDLLKYDSDNFYQSDVKGNGTASMDPINIVMTPIEGITYSLSQVADDNAYATWNPITNKAIPGFPIKVTPTTIDNKELVGVEINGEFYDDYIFVVSSTATIKPVYKVLETNDYIGLTVPAGQVQSYYLTASGPDKEISIDWGNGEKVPVKVKETLTHIEGTTKGTNVKIYGAIVGADFSSYPHINADNKISAVDVSHNANIHYLSTYMNNIGTLDVSNLANLDTLDCAYSDLAKLDIAKNKKLVCLRANGNALENIDLKNAENLQYLEINNNNLDELDLSKNSKLVKIIAGSNSLTSIDVAAMANLEVLRISKNVIGTLNLDKNTKLTELDVAENTLTKLNVSKNKALSHLMVNGNKLEGLDLTGLDNLSYLNIGDNKWDACTLNDVYYTLSQYKAIEGAPAGYKLFSRGDNKEKYNDAEKAESKLATNKGWVINYEGNGSGCDMAYITIETPENGTVKVYTTTDKEVMSGTKVKKNSELKVVSTPAKGYAIESAKANGTDIKDNKFVVTSATTVVVKFTVDAGIEGVNQNKTVVQGGNRELTFSTSEPTEIRVYAPNGKLVFADTITGTQSIGVPSGVYIVKTRGVAKAVAVK